MKIASRNLNLMARCKVSKYVKLSNIYLEQIYLQLLSAIYDSMIGRASDMRTQKVTEFYLFQWLLRWCRGREALSINVQG